MKEQMEMSIHVFMRKAVFMELYGRINVDRDKFFNFFLTYLDKSRLGKISSLSLTAVVPKNSSRDNKPTTSCCLICLIM